MGVIEKIKLRAQKLKDKIVMLHLATKHPGTPWYAKIFILLIVAYALSPIDLIPDFIPVIGLLDELILLPFGIWLAVKMIPENVRQECAEAATAYKWKKKKNFFIAAFIILLWIVFGAILLSQYWKK